MKSKRAEEYIGESIYDAGDLVDKDGCGWAVVKRSDAYRAVELAEEDMVEKVGLVFSEYCEMYAGGGKCLEGGECTTCARIREFKQKLKRI